MKTTRKRFLRLTIFTEKGEENGTYIRECLDEGFVYIGHEILPPRKGARHNVKTIMEKVVKWQLSVLEHPWIRQEPYVPVEGPQRPQMERGPQKNTKLRVKFT